MSFIRLHMNPPFAEIVLNRPEKRNAISIDMWAAIPGLIEQAEQDRCVKIVLIHGGNTGHFAAGADISEFSTLYGNPESATRSGQIISQALLAVERCRKPVISVIEGDCVGGGVSLSLASDIRIARHNVRMGITPAKLGLVYPPVDTRLLMQTVGLSAAKDLLFTGRLIKAEEALQIGLVDKICSPDDTVLSFARAYAHQIASVSQWSVRAIKQMMSGLKSGWSYTSLEAQALFLEGFSNADHKEGYSAFLEKRDPEYPIE